MLAGDPAGHPRSERDGAVAGSLVEAHGQAPAFGAGKVDLHDDGQRPRQTLVDAEQHVGEQHPPPGGRPQSPRRFQHHRLRAQDRAARSARAVLPAVPTDNDVHSRLSLGVGVRRLRRLLRATPTSSTCSPPIPPTESVPARQPRSNPTSIETSSSASGLRATSTRFGGRSGAAHRSTARGRAGERRGAHAPGERRHERLTGTILAAVRSRWLVVPGVVLRRRPSTSDRDGGGTHQPLPGAPRPHRRLAHRTRLRPSRRTPRAAPAGTRTSSGTTPGG